MGTHGKVINIHILIPLDGGEQRVDGGHLLQSKRG
jgi:hypothetical protein